MEAIIRHITLIVSYAAEALAAVIIGVAVVQVLLSGPFFFSRKQPVLLKEKVRVQFGSSVAVALELLLGADVLATAVAPNWNDIGQLAAIAIIRTALNYFLGVELKAVKKAD